MSRETDRRLLRIAFGIPLTLAGLTFLFGDTSFTIGLSLLFFGLACLSYDGKSLDSNAGADGSFSDSGCGDGGGSGGE